MTRIGAMFADPRTWSTLLYFLLMLPLGVLYFSIAVTCLATSIGLIAGPVVALFVEGARGGLYLDGEPVIPLALAWPLSLGLGVFLLFATLHLARGIGYGHARLAHHLLVKTASGDASPAPAPLPTGAPAVG
jgi:hypothetical protein